MNKKLLLGLAAFCTMGLPAGAWAADAATADEVIGKVKEASAAVKAGVMPRWPTSTIPRASGPGRIAMCSCWTARRAW
jgi:hypothetical protein